MPFNWTCPHCSVTQTVVDQKCVDNTRTISLSNQVEGDLLISDMAVGCSNPDCLKTTIRIKIAPGRYRNSDYRFDTDGETVFDQFVYPQGMAKPQPDFIPKPIREDYKEACLIRELSPKASATLIRRCLQGMIRHFAGISKATLYAEIQSLRASVDGGTADRAISTESVDAIDSVRGIGNIGAHMEKDINQILEVDPGEAQALIDLVEMLFDEWYGAREKRKERLAHIGSIAAAKATAKDQLSAPAAQNALAAPATAADLLGAKAEE